MMNKSSERVSKQLGKNQGAQSDFGFSWIFFSSFSSEQTEAVGRGQAPKMASLFFLLPRMSSLLMSLSGGGWVTARLGG